MTVKCRDCGYLALRNMYTRQLFEVEDQTRENGNLPQDSSGPSKDGAQSPYMLMPPVCFRMVAEFREEARTIRNGDNGGFLKLINADRKCDEQDQFTKWKQGWTPS